MIKQLSLACALALIVACTGDTDDKGTDTEDTNTTSDTESDGMELSDSTWATTSYEVTENSCDFEIDTGDTGSAGQNDIAITADSETTFTMSYGGGEGVEFSCTLSGSDFSCEDVESASDLTGGSGEASLTQTNSMSGTFTSSTTMEADYALTMDCEGADCATYEGYLPFSVPCSYAISGEASKTE